MDEAKKWFDMAEEDLLWAKASLKEEIWRGACFAAQQAAEKSLKAYLLAKNKSFPKIHDLVSLNDSCRNIDNEFEEYSGNMAGSVVKKAEEIVEFVKLKLN